MVAGESFLAHVDLHVLVQVCLLGKSVCAVLESALVGPLLSVDAEVVEEVVPLAEHLGAAVVSAAQESDDSSVLWGLVLIYHEVLGAWNVLLDAYLVEVKVRSLRN